MVRGRYRYSLTRWWVRPVSGIIPFMNHRVVWVMLNPSTADALVDDPTIRRVRSFSESWNFCSFEVVNLFAYRTPSPAHLWKRRCNIVGLLNRDYIRQAVFNADRVIVAWGAGGGGGERMNVAVADMKDLARSTGTKLWCLGTTKNNGPRHPLYLRADTQLERWA